ncbi:glyoxalase superfamily protein [Kineococcus sp. SYSU DK018]|uniref:glyoxalase superfamily protein n=1 Tax=Kineococcus sp. SYSU DK018 TaxID=3383139 RepID=UPI003D7E8B36
MRSTTIELAKKLAKRLRSDLAEAGIEITHSFALELIAHQHGVRDWNELSARSSHGPGRTQTVDVVTQPMTVGELRGLLEGVPDHAEVHATHPDSPLPSATASMLPATGGHVRHDSRQDVDQFVLLSEFGTGRYQAPAEATFEVERFSEEAADAEQLFAAVSAATEHLRGGAAYRAGRDDAAGRITWTWTSDSTPLAPILDAARKAFSDLHPWGWRVIEDPAPLAVNPPYGRILRHLAR